MPAIPSRVHVISLNPTLYEETPVDGQTMRDWLEQATFDPTGVSNRVVEGNLVEEIPGVEPFPCEVSP